MKATTVKLDGAILRELKEFKEPDQNLTSLVRDLLKAQIHRRKMARAAEEYIAFMSENPAELQELDTWATTPLDNDKSVRRRKKA